MNNEPERIQYNDLIMSEIFSALLSLNKCESQMFINYKNCSQVCHFWQTILNNDTLWKAIFERIKGQKEKFFADSSYKKNLFSPFCILHTYLGNSEIALKDYCQTNQIRYTEVLSNNELISEPEYIDIMNQAISLNPQILCSLFNEELFCWETMLIPFLESIKKYDILLILSIGHGGISRHQVFKNKDLHKDYPNVIWMTSCHKNYKIKSYSNFGEIVDIALHRQRGVRYAIAELAKFASYLRALRPDLSAQEIRKMIIETSKRTEESKVKIPNGGILDREAAIKAVKDCPISSINIEDNYTTIKLGETYEKLFDDLGSVFRSLYDRVRFLDTPVR
jgi:hypothetical protein